MNKEALKLALEALDNLLYWDNGKPEYDEAREAITAIKQALAAPVQEPVAWRWKNNGEDKWLNEYTYLDRGGPDCPEECEPLYTTPPAQPAPVTEGWKQVPVEPTDEMLDAAQSVVTDIYRVDADRVYTAMVQAAHGIKEKNT